jgi:TonB family protein
MKSNLFSLKSIALICTAVIFLMTTGFAQNCEPTSKVVKKEGSEVKSKDNSDKAANNEEKPEPALTVKLTNVDDPKKNLVQSSTVTITESNFTKEQEVEIKDANTPYYWPSEKAVYIDGNNELYIAAGKVNYPAELRKDKVQGIVVVQIIVEKDGSITNPQVIAPVHAKLDDEALKAVGKLKCFVPAKHNGEVVRSYFTIPVPFLLPEKVK